LINVDEGKRNNVNEGERDVSSSVSVKMKVSLLNEELESNKNEF